jgi:general secretion pathway protein G
VSEKRTAAVGYATEATVGERRWWHGYPEGAALAVVFLASVGLLMAGMGSAPSRGPGDLTVLQVKDRIPDAIARFRLHTGQLPNKLSELAVNPGLNGWEGPYAKPEHLVDTSGNPLTYVRRGDGYTLRGKTRDGQVVDKDE